MLIDSSDAIALPSKVETQKQGKGMRDFFERLFIPNAFANAWSGYMSFTKKSAQKKSERKKLGSTQRGAMVLEIHFDPNTNGNLLKSSSNRSVAAVDERQARIEKKVQKKMLKILAAQTIEELNPSKNGFQRDDVAKEKLKKEKIQTPKNKRLRYSETMQLRKKMAEQKILDERGWHPWTKEDEKCLRKLHQRLGYPEKGDEKILKKYYEGFQRSRRIPELRYRLRDLQTKRCLLEFPTPENVYVPRSHNNCYHLSDRQVKVREVGSSIYYGD